jgi:hypothetical protein
MTGSLSHRPRIVVIGASGSGKTTFSRRLAELLGRKCIELDALHWGPRWTPRADFRERVLEETAAAHWVVDGNYGAVRDDVWPRATAVVWLNYSFPTVFYRVVRRTVGRLLTGEVLFAGNTESFRSAFFDPEGVIWYSVRSHGRYRREFPRLLAHPSWAHLDRIELESPAEAESLLRREAASAVPEAAR